MKRAGASVCLALALHTLVLATPGIGLAQGKAPAPAAAPAAPSAPVDLIARGQALFDDQQYEESVQTLSAALLRPSNTKAQRVEIHRLLALNYITLGRKDEADSAIRGLLVIEPNYQLPGTESPRFRDVFAAVRAKWEGEGRPGLLKDEGPAQKPVVMKHASPAQVEAGVRVELIVRLEDPASRVADVRLFYRASSKDEFTDIPVAIEGGRGRVQIPGSAIKPPVLEYYFVGNDKTGTQVVTRGDSSSPLRIAVPDKAGGGWVLPVAIGGGILGAAAIVGGLALAGVFKSSSPGTTNPTPVTPGPGRGTVSVSITE
jgi:hypothetical protein